MTAKRMLLAAGGGGSIAAPTAEQGRWVRQGAIILADQPWEYLGVLEPCVLYDGGVWKMWYRGGGLHGPNSTVGYATCSGDPTVPANWVKTSNVAPLDGRLFGNGHNGEAADVAEQRVVKVGSTYYMIYNTPYTSPQKLKSATSSDGLAWTVVGNPAMSFPTNCNLWGNASFWNEGGTTWKMLVEAYNTSSALWVTYYATSTNGTSWTIGNSGNPLSTLQPAANCGYGGPDVQIIDGVYHNWYHASGTPGGTSDIYRAYSHDAITWTQITPNPVLTRTGTNYEIDQIADPHVIEATTSFMFYDADSSTAPTVDVCAIKLATFAGTLSTLVHGH